MSQIVGRRLPQPGVANQDFISASVTRTDSQGNAGMHTVAYGPSSTTYVDDVDAVALGIYYYYDKAPDADPAGSVWRVQRSTLVSPGVTKYEWAYVPANVYKGSYVNVAAINVAYPTGQPGWNVYNEDSATYWVWDPFAGPAAWVDTLSAVRIPESNGSFGSYDHAAANIRILNYR